MYVNECNDPFFAVLTTKFFSQFNEIHKGNKKIQQIFYAQDLGMGKVFIARLRYFTTIAAGILQ